MAKKQERKNSKATLLPLAVGVGVGALYGVNVPLDANGHNVFSITAKAADASLELPKAGADYTKDAGDTTHYNIIGDGTSISFHNGLQSNTTYLAPTNYQVKALTLYKGEYYGAVAGKYDTKIIKYDPITHLWNEQAVLDSVVYNLIPTETGLIAGAGSAGTYGADFRLYSSEDGKNWSTRISGYRSFSSTTASDIGFFYTGVEYKSGAVLFGGTGKWTFVRESQDSKTFNLKQEIYGTYTDSVNGDGKIVAIGSQSTTNDPYGSIAMSDNGGEYQVFKMGVGEVLTGVTYGNGKFVAVGDSRYLGAMAYTSTDGVNWKRTNIPTDKKILRDVDWDAKNERFVAVGDGGKMLVSKDGENWVTLSVGANNNITKISMKDNVPDDYDYAWFKLSKLWRDIRALSYKDLKPEDVNAMKEKYEALKAESYEKVTVPNLLNNLNTGVVKYIQQDLDKLSGYNIMYLDFLDFKEKAESMPSGTLEEKATQIEAIKKYESEITATKYPAPISNYITSFKNEVTGAYLREKLVSEANLYVEKAEKTLRQSDYDTALKKVQALPYNDQSPFVLRLNSIIQPVKLQEAKVAIENYKKDFSSTNESLAVSKINVLVSPYLYQAQELYFYARMERFDELLTDFIKNPTPDKVVDLNKFLQSTPLPNDATRKIMSETSNKFRGEVDIFARDFLPKNFAMANTKFKAEYYLNSNKVTNSMTYAEYTKFQPTISLLQQMNTQQFTVGLVEAVEANPADSATKTKALSYINNFSSSFSQLKTLLLNRLENANVDRYQKESETLLSSLTNEYNAELVKQAEASIALVKDATKKEAFTGQLENIKEKEVVHQATDAVNVVEETPSYDGVEKATPLIDVVKDAGTKEELKKRLDVVVEELKVADVLADIATFETEPTLEARDGLFEKVADVKDETKREQLKDSVEMVWNQHLTQVATIATEKAEQSLSQDDYKQAVQDIEVLVSGDTKDELMNRIEEVSYKIQVNDAKDAVSSLEKSLNPEDVKTVIIQVNELRDGEDKDALVERIAQVQQVILVENAKDAVTELESNPNQKGLDEIKTSLENIHDGFEKTDLQKRIEAVQQGIWLSESEALIEKAMEEPSQANVDKAKESVSRLTDSKGKSDLMTTIDLLQQSLDAEPVEAMLQKFQEKLDGITKRPKKSEADSLTAEYNSIVKAVDGLKNGTVKEELKKELTETKKTLDSVIKNGNHPNQAPGQTKKAPFLVRVVIWVVYSIFGR